MSASTYNGGGCAASLGRLNLAAGSGKAGSWCANRNNVNQWLQIDLGTPTTITKVATQKKAGRISMGNKLLTILQLGRLVLGPVHCSWEKEGNYIFTVNCYI